MDKGGIVLGKVTHVKKSRKEYKCGKCGKIIPVGSEYYKGELNFSPPIIRCEECGLKSYEVTTSDYQLRVGKLQSDWECDYDASTEDCQEEIASELDSIQEELQERLDNMLEGLQEGDTGQLLQARIDSCEQVASDIRNIEVDEDADEDTQEEERRDQIQMCLDELEC